MPWGIWNLPGPGIKPLSPELVGRLIINHWKTQGSSWLTPLNEGITKLPCD